MDTVLRDLVGLNMTLRVDVGDYERLVGALEYGVGAGSFTRYMVGDVGNRRLVEVDTNGELTNVLFLGDLEPMLIELAYEAYRHSPATRDRMQQEVKDNLLFRVRLISQQLNNSTLST